MEMFARYLMGILVSALVAAGLVASPVMAQDKAKDVKAAPVAKVEKGKVTVKVLLDNAKVRAQEITWKPGDVNSTIATNAYRVLRVLKGGTVERTYADGKKETVVWKTGEVQWQEPSQAYTTKNIGKSELQLYVVLLK